MNTILLILQLICIILAIIYFYSAIKTKNNKEIIYNDCSQEISKLAKMREIHLTQPLNEKTRPKEIKEIIGQKQAIHALRGAICSANPQHIIIYGPPGVGKTAAARVILEEAKRNPLSPFKSDAPFIEMDATTLQYDERAIADPLLGSVHDPIYQGAGALGNAGIPQPKEGAVTKAHGGILFIDEIGELPPYHINRLLKVLEDRKVFFNSSYYSKSNKNIPAYIHDIFKNGLPADFRLIGATTKRPEDIPPAIRSRCCEIFFDSLSEDEIKLIAKNAINKSNFYTDEEFLNQICLYTHNGRDTVGLIEKCIGLAMLDNKKILTNDILTEAAESSRYFKHIQPKPTGTSYIGRVNGLAVMGSMGVLMDIEATATKAINEGKLIVCGISQQESIKSGNGTLTRKSTAYSSVENALTLISNLTGINPKDYIIHLNFTGGHIVDGPSAGIAIFCCLYSAIFNLPITDKLALTGEISIQGRVLPVGGIKEKINCAFSNNINTVIIPEDNYSINMETTGGNIIPVNSINQILENIFPNTNEKIV